MNKNNNFPVTAMDNSVIKMCN